MPGASPDNSKPKLRGMLRFAALAGIAVGLASLFHGTHQEVSGRGRPRTRPSAESVGEGYEVQDISAGGVVKILIAFAFTTAIVIGIVLLMRWRFLASETATNAVLTSEQTAQMEPPGPHLQVNPFDDLAREQARENRLLNSYGWTDPGHTLARIPISRAMALSVGKSLDAGP